MAWPWLYRAIAVAWRSRKFTIAGCGERADTRFHETFFSHSSDGLRGDVVAARSCIGAICDHGYAPRSPGDESAKDTLGKPARCRTVDSRHPCGPENSRCGLAHVGACRHCGVVPGIYGGGAGPKKCLLGWVSVGTVEIRKHVQADRCRRRWAVVWAGPDPTVNRPGIWLLRTHWRGIEKRSGKSELRRPDYGGHRAQRRCDRHERGKLAGRRRGLGPGSQCAKEK